MNQSSATEFAGMVRRREVSATELVCAALERIAQRDPAIGAVVQLRADAALVEAAEIDSGEREGVLCGVPITIKEAIHVAGMRSTWGLQAAAEHVATQDATVVARLRAAGAIVVGTTNVHEMLADFGQTVNPIYGRTNNPWDITRVPGGSSGGAAAAVASELSFLDIGSDLVGSIRIPAAFCGVYGLKPSEGCVPLEGARPPGAPQAPAAASYLLALGPLARSAGDLRAALRLIADADLRPPRVTRLEDFRVGFVLDDPAVPTADDVREVLEAAVEAIAGAGSHMTAGWPEGVDPVADAATFGRHVQAFISAGNPTASGEDPTALRSEPARTAARTAWSRHFRDVDVLVCPVAPTAAFPHDDRPFGERTVETAGGELPYERIPFWVAQPTLSGLPAVSVPVGQTPAGLPVGLQVIGPHGEDDTVITFAERLAELLGCDARPPEAATAQLR